jgi:uncharacterized protein YfaS (alpha-2-macroglobulin family)
MQASSNLRLRNILFIIVAICLLIAGCKKKRETVLNADPKFRELITAYTSGIIPTQSTIRIRLAYDYSEKVEPNTPIDKNLFEFSPDIKGSSYWLDNRTIEFRPSERLKSGTIYTCKFYLSKIIEVKPDLKTFEFGFQTIMQSYSVRIQGFKPYENTNLIWNKITGTIITSDEIETDEIVKVLSAHQGTATCKIHMISEPDKKVFNFSIDSIQRTEKENIVNIDWDGKPIELTEHGSEKVTIPALSDFKLMQTQVNQEPEQFIKLIFSDPLMKSQNLEGLIRMENGVSLTYAVNDNEIRIYPAVRQKGSVKLNLEEGIKNIMGFRFKESQAITIAFESVKPAVRLTGKGVILPNSQGLIFPFEAVNLKAVNIKIIRIFENNVTQFLQVNKMDGQNELKRVGRLILKKEVPLSSNSAIDYSTWNTFFLDLATLIKQEPGAIYRIEIGFTRKNSIYPCAGKSDSDNTEEMDATTDDDYAQEIGYWDSYENYYEYDEGDYYYGENYDGSKRDDPCAKEYYGKRRSVARNLFASDLGIIAKGGNNKSMTFAVTNLITTEPLAGVTLDIFNYQKQLITTATTNGEGLATIKIDSKPFLLIAKKDDQRGYLKLDEGSSLSISNFDVAGNNIQKGIKGFLYGERGVWRPGDTVFLTFILEDKEKLLPANHPVILELINPQGQVANHFVKTSGVNGFYSFTVTTSPDAPTGNWTANINVGGTVFSKILKIETIKPNRLKINFDFGKEKLSVKDKNLKATLKATWLHGAIAKNLRTIVAVSLNQIYTSFPKYNDYEFDDPIRRFNSEDKNIFEGKVNDDGEAQIPADITVNDAAPGMLQANFTTRIFEESGDFSIDRFSIPYAPYESFVGIKTPEGDRRGMLITDTLQTVHVVTLDADGHPISRSGLEAKLYKVQWRWWWDASGDDLATYIGRENTTPVYSEVFSTTNGKGSFGFKVKYPEWGRFLIRVSDPVSGHTTGKIVYIDWPGWVGRNRTNPEAATVLSFNSDKTKYSVGEEASVTFPSPENARALVSVESGSKVINAWWVHTTKNETRFSFKITDEMSPNVYVNITMVQPHFNKNNDLPIRLYGIIPIMVENPETHLQPEFSMPDVLRPESSVSIKVREKQGKEMTYTLAMVDEGLLDLTRFKTPDAWASFYAREALGVRTWDLYDYVLGAYAGKLQSILSIGGDGSEAQGAKSKANRFKPMVKFLGPFSLEKGKTGIHTIQLPQYIGSVKTMLVAGQAGAYGLAEKVTPVKKPLMLLATLPRVLGPMETVRLPVTVFAMEKSIKSVQVTISANNLLIPQDATIKTISFNEIGDQIVNFDLQVAKLTGIAKVKVTAKSGSESAQYDLELDVRNSNTVATNFVDAVIEPGKTWDGNCAPAGMPGTNKAMLEVSSIPPIDFGRRLKYLLSYPYGCIEQTTSAAFPQLFLADVVDMNDAAKDMATKNIKAALERIRLFMLSDGGFSYWPGLHEADDWATSYAGHFIIEAELKGFTIPASFKSSWIKYQKNTARNWVSGNGKFAYYRYQQSDLEQAYRLYTLALAGEPDLASMNRLRERSDISLQARWRLAAAYTLAGQKEVASSLVNNLSIEIPSYSSFNSTYGSAERDRAMILETLSLMNMRDKAIGLMMNISKSLSSNSWMSTQTTAYCLLAMSKFSGSKTTSKNFSFEYSLNGSKAITASSNLSILQIDMKMNDEPKETIKITNKSSGVIFARISLTGVPEPGKEVASENNLKMNIVYKSADGKTILDISDLKQGTDFRAELTISNPSLEYYSNLALNQIFPSGWEIHNSRMDLGTSSIKSDVPSYQDIRDDRIYTYFDLSESPSKKTFVVLLNAAYLGKFYLPRTSCEAMYDNHIQTVKTGQWVKVSENK